MNIIRSPDRAFRKGTYMLRVSTLEKKNEKEK